MIISAIAASSQTASPGAPASIDGLVSAAKGAAGLDWSGTFMRLCIVPPPAARGDGRGAGAAPPGPPAKATWYAEPAKVADNFYFIGTKIHNAWALVGSDGIIIFEALFDYAAPDEIADGMRKLGLDMQQGQVRRSFARPRRPRRRRAISPGQDAGRAPRLRRAGLGCGRQVDEPPGRQAEARHGRAPTA